MKTSNLTHLMIAAALVVGCVPGDDTGANDSTTGADSSATMTSTTNTTTNTTTADTTGMSASMTTTDTTTADSTDSMGSSSSTTEDPATFHFNETPPDMYTRVDRMGFPAVNTGLHIHGDKDMYNAMSPVDDVDAMGYFDDSVAETAASLLLLHYGPDNMPAGTDGLDDELQPLFPDPPGPGLATCSPPSIGIAGSCADQGGGLAAYPDVLKLSTELPPGFHIDPDTCGPVANGRMPANPAIDIILTVLTLNLAAPPLPEASGVGFQCDAECDPDTEDCPHALATAFLNLPAALNGGDADFSLNPIANDADFPAEFPYLAPAHTP